MGINISEIMGMQDKNAGMSMLPTSTIDSSTRDNQITNDMVASGKLPASQAENYPQSASPITSESIKPTAPITITQPKIPTESAGLGGVIETQTDRFFNDLNTAKTDSETTKNSSLDAYIKQLMGVEGEVALTAKEYAKGVDPLEAEVRDIYQQIFEEQESLRRRLEAIDKRGGGLKMGAAAEKANIERESIAKQADLSVIALAKQGRYDSAKAIADRAVAAKLEQQKNITEALKLNYEENKELFTTAEQRAFEVMLGDRERKLSMEAQKEMARYEQTIRENDPLYKAQVSQAYQSMANAQQDRLIKLAELGNPDAMVALGLSPNPNGYDPIDAEEARTVQKEIVGNDAYKAVRKGQDSLLALKQFEELFNQVGTTSGVTSPIENRELLAKYNAAILNLKEFFNLGVLNGPDETILRGVLPDPTSQGLITNPFAKQGTLAGIQNMKEQIEQTLDDRYLSVKSQYSRYNPDDIPLINDLDRVYIQQKAALNPQVKQFIDENPDMPLDEVLQVINTKI